MSTATTQSVCLGSCLWRHHPVLAPFQLFSITQTERALESSGWTVPFSHLKAFRSFHVFETEINFFLVELPRPCMISSLLNLMTLFGVVLFPAQSALVVCRLLPPDFLLSKMFFLPCFVHMTLTLSSSLSPEVTSSEKLPLFHLLPNLGKISHIVPFLPDCNYNS